MRLPRKWILFSSAAVFLLVFTLWLLVQNRVTVLNAPEMDPGMSAAVPAGWVTLQYVLAVLFLWWLSRYPERQRTAAFIAGGLVAFALLLHLFRVLSVPSQITSPLVPDNLVTYVQLQDSVRALPVLLGSFAVTHYFLKRRWLAVVIASLATYFLFAIWNVVWILLPIDMKNFGMF